MIKKRHYANYNVNTYYIISRSAVGRLLYNISMDVISIYRERYVGEGKFITNGYMIQTENIIFDLYSKIKINIIK